MTVLLHLSAAGAHYWTRSKQGWQRLPEAPAPSQPVWVVTDLAEEGFAEIETPRVHGRDRSDLLARQLGMRFADTPYRMRLNIQHGDALIDRLLPTRHTLFGITSADKINAELDAKSLSVAALCPMSLLLTRIGQSRRLPADLFIVLPSAAGLRIVFLKNRIPVLTRLAAIPDQASAQAEEIIRTHRYLENMRTIARNSQPAVLVLGDGQAFDAPLSAARLNVIESTGPWRGDRDTLLKTLFDRALRHQPFGQLAPIERRTVYLSGRLRQASLAAAALSLCAGVGAAALNLSTIFDIERDKAADQATSAQLNDQIAALDRRIAAMGPSPEQVRQVVELNANEIERAPAFEHHLRQIGQALRSEGSARVAELEWQLLDAGVQPCAKRLQEMPGHATTPTDDAAANADANADSGAAAPATRQVEIFYKIILGADVTPRARAQTVQAVSAQLTQMARLPQSALLMDPAKSLATGTLRGGDGPASDDERTFSWCLALPGIPPTEPQPLARAGGPTP